MNRPGKAWPGGDDGSIIPMIIGFFAVASLVVAGTIAAGSAFLAQRDVQSVCDGAALAGAQALDDNGYFLSGAPGGRYRLSRVQAAVDRYHAEDGRGVDLTASVDGAAVEVRCHELADVPFGRVFGYEHGVNRDTTAHAVPQRP